jgi:tRNA(Met) cytidine acetyltransferase
LGSLEGDLDPAVCADVLAGRRRVHGHLLNQSLAVHAGLAEALRLRALRIQRIAVHPEFQRRGLGSRLLASAGSWAAREGVDFIGCAFGIDPKLMAFWQNRGLSFARLGMRVDPASAARTVLMTQGLTAAGRQLSQCALQWFQRDLPWALGAVLSDLSPDLALRLLRGRDCSDIALDDDDQAALAQIASGARQVETAAAALWRWVITMSAAGVTGRDFAPLLAWRLQHWSIDRVCEAFELAGSRALHRCLREQLVRSLPVVEDG